MKYFIVTLLSVLLISSCARHQEADPVSIPDDTQPAVITQPSAVILPHHGDSSREIARIRKMMEPHNIKILEAPASRLQFVKSDGLRIAFDIPRLSRDYDLILFNTVNDPLPCRFNDLKRITGMLFGHTDFPPLGITQGIPAANDSAAPAHPLAENQYTDDSLRSVSPKRHRTVVIDSEDATALPMKLRNTGNRRWVIQLTDKRKILKLSFENDLITYNNTDRYFTNGITMELQSQGLRNWRFRSLMIPLRKPAGVEYRLRLVQNIYTPSTTLKAPDLGNDRPYASYLFMGYGRTIIDPALKLRLTSEIVTGYLGPYSPGSYLQSVVHETFPTNDKPQGWETQIKTDFILNYNIDIEKALVDHQRFMLAGTGGIEAGTLYSRVSGGLAMQAGRFEPHFAMPGSTVKKAQIYFYSKAAAHAVAYDATLQGGLLSGYSESALSRADLQPFTFTAETGLRFTYHNTGLELTQHYQSPEFRGCTWHKWGRITLILNL